ncbi:hypothetical protein BDW59DRAFT_150447 [Aspergillus cavernicola]|uniref:Fungal-type protein kinase domain-containing protein n=1 Tax=Aspergillus cavernicola TaxID=176166 RepID=A0ABR4HZF0_9EURO
MITCIQNARLSILVCIYSCFDHLLTNLLDINADNIMFGLDDDCLFSVISKRTRFRTPAPERR